MLWREHDSVRRRLVQSKKVGEEPGVNRDIGLRSASPYFVSGVEVRWRWYRRCLRRATFKLYECPLPRVRRRVITVPAYSQL